MPSVLEKLQKLRKEYKHQAFFAAATKVVPVEEEGVQIAKASLDNLSAAFAPDMYEKLKTNPDLLAVASNLIQADAANLNDDCIMYEDLVSVARDFIDKYIDEEHDTSKIFGVIKSVGFSKVGTDEPIADVLAISDRFSVQLVIAGYLWYLVDPNLCEMIETSSSLNDQKFSTSFEVLYNGYWVGVGPTRNVADARIIVPQDKDFKLYSKMLRKNGGSGKDGENIVFCILKDILPVGAGIVAAPASGIKGVLTVDAQNLPADPVEAALEKINDNLATELPSAIPELVEAMQGRSFREVAEAAAELAKKGLSTEEVVELLTKPVESFIQTEEISVSTSTISNLQETNMKIELKSKEDISAKWAELVKNEANASTITDFIIEQYEKPARKFAEDIQAQKEIVTTVEANKAEAETKVKELEASVAALTQKLAELEAAAAAAAQAEVFGNRMAELDNVFELDDEIRNILVDEVKSLSTDEAFAAWMDKKKKLMKDKTKKDIKDKKDAAELAAAALAVASASVVPKVDVAAVVASTTEIPNQAVSSAPAATETLAQKIHNAFHKNVKIGGKTLEKSKK